jgi:histidine ammonia-lyase
MLAGENKLTIDDLVQVAREHKKAELSPKALDSAKQARELIQNWIKQGKAIYGVTTGFGALCDRTIPSEEARLLQENILKSHAAGVGEPLPEEVVRAVMAIRLQDLSQGYSGVRPQTLTALLDLLNSEVVPIVPEKGSVGASGDLCPMAHLALVLIGHGQAWFRGEKMSGARALAEAGLRPLCLEAGEGLALINGTQVMTAIAALSVHDARILAKTADIACAMSLEVLMGSNTEFDQRIQAVRPHPGQAAAAANMALLTDKSEIISSHKDCGRIQDAYTLRCSPQIHGASRGAMEHITQVVDTEINSSTTNPLIFPDTKDFLLGGNFHGQPVALAADYLGIALAEFASVSERRIERLVNPQLSGLPAFLVEDSGLNSGFMIAQYTAAALVSENKTLAHPACVDSIPTSANKEDHVSMGTISARKARSILKNAAHVLAIELLCGAQALDLLTNGRPGPGTEAAYQAVRNRIPKLDRDRILAPDIDQATEMVLSGEIVAQVEKKVGPLK